MKISENTSVSMPIRNMVMIIAAVAMGVFAYTEVTARLTSLETSRELFENDLLKKSEQVPTDQEQHFLLEDLYKTTAILFSPSAADIKRVFASGVRVVTKAPVARLYTYRFPPVELLLRLSATTK